PNSTICYPSSVISTRQPSNTRMKQGSHPVRDGVKLVVAPTRDRPASRRKARGGSKGKLPTMAEKLQFVLYYYKTYPTFDGLAMQFGMTRSKANANLHKLSPMLYDTLVHLELMPYRELT